MRVLVLGGCGLVGSLAVRELVELGHEPVVGDISLRTTAFSDIAEFVHFVRVDILQLAEIVGVIQQQQVERVLDLASFLSPGVNERPYAGVVTNILGTLNVYEAARLTGTRRVCFTSTGKARLVALRYADSLNAGRPAVEPDPYTSTKIACELLANDYRRMYGMDLIIARFCGQIYGPGRGLSGGLGKALEPVADRLLRGEPAELVNTRSSRHLGSDRPVDLLCARDAAHGAVLATVTDGMESTVFNITPFEARTLPEIGEVLRELIPGCRLETGSSDHQGGRVPVDPHARDELGYEPRYDLRSGLAEYLEFLREGRLQAAG